MVGRIEDETDIAGLPGGAALILKAARAAGGWHCWATRGVLMLPVKVVAAKDSADGKAVYEDRPHERVLVKGRSSDGWQRMVVQYVKHRGSWTVASAYVFDLARRSFEPATVAEVKAYLKGE